MSMTWSDIMILISFFFITMTFKIWIWSNKISQIKSFKYNVESDKIFFFFYKNAFYLFNH